MLEVELDEESAGAAGAVVLESAGAPGEVDCCFAQATRASALMHNKRRLRFIRSPHCRSGSNRRGSFTVPGGTQRSDARGVPLQHSLPLASPRLRLLPSGPRGGDVDRGIEGRRALRPAPRRGKLLLGGDALLLFGRILRAGLAERALINLAATAPAISLTHENAPNRHNEGREVYRAAGPRAKRTASWTCVSVATRGRPRSKARFAVSLVTRSHSKVNRQ